jgi:hypothetical protein
MRLTAMEAPFPPSPIPGGRAITPPANFAQPNSATRKAAVPGGELAGAPRPRHERPGRDHPGIWLHAAAAGLLALSGAAAAVSFAAQYRLVYAARHLAAAAALEAAIPDAAALVFACLGVALAVHGRRAFRARLLNAASAGTSVLMNLIAAAPGWRDLAVWAMPPTAYALASDTLIGVVRAGAVTRHREAADRSGDASLLAAAGGLALWLLRLAMAPASTLSGFRAWVIEECPVAPGRRAQVVPSGLPVGPQISPVAASADRPAVSAVLGADRDGLPGVPVVPPVAGVGPAVVPAERAASRPLHGSRLAGTKTARFLALVTEQYGPLAGVPLASVARISAAVAPQADLNVGAARAALRRAVLAGQDGEH